MWHFGGAVQFENVAARIVAADGTPRLERHAAVPTNGKIEFDDGMGARHAGVDIAITLAQHSRLGAPAG